MVLGMSEHGLEGQKSKEVLHVFFGFCVDVYLDLFFKIKVQHHLKHGPRHVVNSLVKVKAQTALSLW